MNFEQALVV